MELESLVAPEADAAGEASRLIERFPELWSGASEGERRRLLLTMLDAGAGPGPRGRGPISEGEREKVPERQRDRVLPACVRPPHRLRGPI